MLPDRPALNSPARLEASQQGLTGPPVRFHFQLRTLFYLLFAVGVFCAAARSLVRGDPGFLLGIGAFCYGGVIAIPCYAFVGSLLVLGAESTWSQRVSEILAAAISAAAWITFVALALSRWPQLCVAYAILIIAINAWIVHSGWNAPEGPCPEETLQRLRQAKTNCEKSFPRSGSDN